MSISNKYRFILLIFLFLVIVSLVYIWYSPVRFHVLMGDDLNIIRRSQYNGFTSSVWNDITNIDMSKFRPFSNIFIGMATRTCKLDFLCFEYVNFIWIALNALLLSFVAYQTTEKWLPSLLLGPVLLIFSRFSYYSAYQVFGIMENLGLTLVLLIVFCIYRFTAHKNFKYIYLGLLLYELLILCTERYLVLAGLFIAVFFIYRRSISIFNMAAASIILILIPAAYILTKEFVFKIPFLVGTGGTNLEATFNIGTSLKFVLKGLANLAGLNNGPSNLSGINFKDVGFIGILFPIAICTVLLLITLVFIRNNKNRRPTLIEYGKFVLILVIFVVSLVISASITIRQEFRWLYSAFAVFTILISYVLSKIKYTHSLIFALMITASLLSADIYYRKYIDNLYFMDGLKTAESAYNAIIESLGSSKISRDAIVVIQNGRPEIKTWYFFNDSFFKIYAGVPSVKVRYLNSVQDIKPSEINLESTHIFSVENTVVHDVTSNLIK